MAPERLRSILKAVERGETSVDDALEKLRTFSFEDLGFAKDDHHRSLRRGFPEVIFGPGKTAGQIAGIARRLAESGQIVLVTKTTSEAYRAEVLAGMAEAFKGVRKATKPAAWDAFQASLAGSPDATVSKQIRDLGTLFGDGRALDESKRVALDPKAELGQRRAALQTLIDSRPEDLRAICEKLLDDRDINALAAKGLSREPRSGALQCRPFQRHALASCFPRFGARSALGRALVSKNGRSRPNAQSPMPAKRAG